MKKRELDMLDLESKLERLIDDDEILTEIQYENVQDLMKSIVEENVTQNFTQLRLLKANLMDKLLKRGSGKLQPVEYKNI